MLMLNDKGLENRALWEEKGYALPRYSRENMRENTEKAPVWVHFGAGNLFRAFHAAAAQRLLDAGALSAGIVAVEGSHYEVVQKTREAHDNLAILVTLKSDGSLRKTVVGSIADTVLMNPERTEEFSRLQAVFSNPSLQMATFTITEKGYSLVDGAGTVTAAVREDFAAGPTAPKSYMGRVASLLYTRYRAGAYPMAMVSTDNCSHNGDKLRAAVLAFAEHWGDRGFMDYLTSGRVSFPWSMIDKITPRPDASVEALLRADGIAGLDPIVTARGSRVAPFVNAEESEYLVIEDDFPNGRPALEQAGLILTDRETVNKVERMKVCTCLNPLHTCLALFGCLLDYTKIADEMRDPDLRRLVERVGYEEGLPVVTNPGVIDPKAFLDTVLTVRLPNPFLPDTPQRIAEDTSQKLAIRFGETIRAYAERPELEVQSLHLIPLVCAGWLRYLMGVDDEGKPFPLADDPLLPAVRPVVAELRLGDSVSAEELAPLLTNSAIFGVNLAEVGLAERVTACFNALLAAPGAVRATLHTLVNA
ncbi:MAG: mannitol dehydrogenase family protein [bacterium]